jgi:hypothetical protein
LSWLLSERQIMREDQVGRLARALMPMAAALPQGAADLHAWLVEDGVPSWCLGRLAAAHREHARVLPRAW